MTEIKLSKQEAKILTDAAGEGGRVTIPDGIKPSTRERTIRRLLRDQLIVPGADGGHTMAPAGYWAVGMEPPRAASGSKKALVAELLRREKGASLPELIAATSWLPHTTRAVLSRLRAGGEELAKSKREDGTTSYRLRPREVESVATRTRASRARSPEAMDAAA